MKLDDMTPTQMPTEFGSDDALLVFKPEGLIVLMPNKYKDKPDDEVPKYLLMAMATAYALQDDMMHDYILEHFKKAVQESSDMEAAATVIPKTYVN